MTTLILADKKIISQRNISPLLKSKPDFVSVISITSTKDARKEIERRHPETVIIMCAQLNERFIQEIERCAQTSDNTKVIYFSKYTNTEHIATASHVQTTIVLIKKNTFAELMSTLLMIHHGGMQFPTHNTTANQNNLSHNGEHRLSNRELQVLKGIASGLTTKMIARKMELSPKTVETYRNRLMKKAKSNCIAELVQYAINNNLTDH